MIRSALIAVVCSSLWTGGCSAQGEMAGSAESAILEGLAVGSGFEANHRTLYNEGWIIVAGGRCTPNEAGSNKHSYVRQSDPSYVLALTYSNSCSLREKSLTRRDTNEL